MKNIFKKKEPKYKQTTPEDSWLTRTWNTSRGRAGIKLFLYGIFVIVVMVLIFFRGEKNPEVYTSTYHSTATPYNQKLQNITLNNYEYKYDIQVGEYHVKYNGKKNLNLDIGYKDNGIGVVKYLVENGTIYKVGIDNNKEPYDSLYENINPDYLDMTKLIDQILLIDPIRQKMDYIYNIDEAKQVVITTTQDYVSKITITDNLDTYNLEFYNIGSVGKISLDD